MWQALSTRAIAVFVLAAASTVAVAGPPFLTDDPEPVDLNHVEVNAIGQQTRAVAGRSGSLSGEVNFGCAAETQCHLALPIAFDSRQGGSSRAGLGDVEFGVKYRFLDRLDDGWSAAVYLLARRSFGERLSLGAELYRRTSAAAAERSATGFNVGAIVSLSPHQDLPISAGRGLTHVANNQRSMFLAYQLEL